MKPSGWRMNTSSCSLPFKKVLLTSNYFIGQPKENAITRIGLMVVIFATGLNVYPTFIPRFCWNHLATNLALYLSTVPSIVYLTLNTHFLSTNFWPLKGTSRQVLFFDKSIVLLLHCFSPMKYFQSFSRVHRFNIYKTDFCYGCIGLSKLKSDHWMDWFMRWCLCINCHVRSFAFCWLGIRHFSSLMVWVFHISEVFFYLYYIFPKISCRGIWRMVHDRVVINSNFVIFNHKGKHMYNLNADFFRFSSV